MTRYQGTVVITDIHRKTAIEERSPETPTGGLTHLCQVDCSTIALWTSLFAIAGCLVSFFFIFTMLYRNSCTKCKQCGP